MSELLYLLSTALPVAAAAIGTGIGQGLISIKSLQALEIQPHASTEINKMALVGMSLVETSAILGLVISIILALDTTVPISYEYAAYGRIGIACAIGISGLIVGIAASYPAQAACLATARQPFFSNKILQLMLVTQSVILTPNIFGFLIALFINSKIPTIFDYNGALQLLAAGLCMGLGTLGPCIGLSIFTYEACKAIGVNRKAYQKILPFTFICEAIIETPIIFSLVIALFILNLDITATSHILKGLTCIAAAICMSLSTMGTGVSTGKTAAAACEHIGIAPETYPALSKIALLGLAMIDTFAIYGFIISILLIYAV